MVLRVDLESRDSDGGIDFGFSTVMLLKSNWLVSTYVTLRWAKSVFRRFGLADCGKSKVEWLVRRKGGGFCHRV